MNLNKIKNLDKCLILVFACLFCISPKTEAENFGRINENATVKKSGLLISNKCFAASFIFPSDTLPGGKNKEAHGWEILFNGKNDLGYKWRGINSDTFPSQAWNVSNGMLSVKSHVKGMDVITREKYANFELVFDFKLTYAANSGIKYFVNKIKNNRTGKMGWNGPEYQIIDDFNHPAVKDHKHDISSTAALYLIYAPQNKNLFPVGKWNHGKIIVKGNHIEHWLNGVKVVSCERGSEDFRRRIATTKFKDYDNYGEAPGGHIMLTDHGGDIVYFKNIKIKRLK